MAVNLDSYLNSYLSPYTMSYNNVSSNSVFDVAAAQSSAKTQADALLAAYKNKGSSSASQTMQKDTAAFLDKYASSLKTLDSSAQGLRGASLDKMLYDKEGNITSATAGKVTDAVKSMVENYNSALKTLNDNADRGSGTKAQLARMVRDPIAAESMKQLGVTVNKDGTLAFDAEKLKTGLTSKTAETVSFTKDLLGGYGGLADSIHKNAQYGMNTSARKLIDNDLASIAAQQETENPYREMYTSIKGNPMLLNNQMAMSMFMNFTV